MPAGLGFIVQAILGMMGSQSLLHVGVLSVRLNEGFLVLMAVCSVRSSCVLYVVCRNVSLLPYLAIVILIKPISVYYVGMCYSLQKAEIYTINWKRKT